MKGNPNPSNGFKKGDPNINRNGAPRVSKEAKVLRKLTTSEFTERFNKYLYYTETQLQEVLENKESTILDLYLCKSLSKGYKQGDYPVLDKMLDRLIGKVKEKVEHSGSMQYSDLTEEQIDRKLNELRRKNNRIESSETKVKNSK